MKRLLFAAGLVLAFVYAFPFFHELRSANEVPRIVLTREIVDHRSFKLDGRWAEVSQGSTFDVSTTPDGSHYSNKAPGVSFVAVPAYLLLKAVTGGEPSVAAVTWTFRITAATLPVLLFLPFFFGLARRFASEAPSRAALCAFALGSMIFPYALVFYSHALSAACAGGSFAAAVSVARGGARRPWLAALGTGFLASAAVLVDYQAALASLAVGAYLLALSPRRVPWAALGAIPPAALLAYYHKVCFGTPWKTGYSFAPDTAHKQGVLGIIGPNLQAMGQAFIAPDNGLFVLMPWAVLAFVGLAWVLLRRELRTRAGAEALVCGFVMLAYFLFIGSTVPEFGRGGWSVGPRYIIVAVPFIAWLAAAALELVDGRAVLRALAHALIVTGVIVFVVAGTTYPHWPIAFRNPLYEVSFHALRQGLAPHSLGTWLGLRGLLSLAPLYVLVAALVAALLGVRDRSRLLTTACAFILGAGIVLSYSRFPGGTPPEKWGFIERTWEPR